MKSLSSMTALGMPMTKNQHTAAANHALISTTLSHMGIFFFVPARYLRSSSSLTCGELLSSALTRSSNACLFSL